MVSKNSRLLTALAAGLMLMAGSVFAAAGDEANADWAQNHSDLKADPAVIFRSLPNGMRYAILKNATPAGQAAIRLRIGSGSLRESDAQQGLAHFLEHMAFKGSTHVPEGEMVKLLQRKGLAFGPDTNASTDWSQTVYMLDLPDTEAESIDIGLMLMRETASELTLSPEAMEPERGVVLSEERLGDTPQRKAAKARIGMLLDGQLAAQRFPIGKPEVIRDAPAGLVHDYYRANYRPDRATLIVAGDIDLAVIEGKIEAYFADWKAAGPATPEPDLGTVKPRGLTAKAVELPGSETRVQIAWVQPQDSAYDEKVKRRADHTAYDTQAKRRADRVDSLGIAVLNRRLAKLMLSEHPPFLSAGASYVTVLRSADAASVTAASSPGAWREALAAIGQEQRRIVQYGISQDELDREIAEFRVSYEQAATGAATRRTTDLVSALVNSVDRDTVFTSPADNLAEFEQIVKGLTAAEVNAALRRIFHGAGPLVEISAPALVEGGDAELAAEYTKAHAVPVSAPAAEAAVVWPYETFGTPGVITGQTDIAGMDATAVSFANGVRLTVKPTKFRTGEVLVDVHVGNGMQDLPKDNSGWLIHAFVAGGLKAISEQDMARVLASRIYGATFNIIDDAFVLGGRTRPQDLGIQLQVLAAYVTDPGYRPEAIQRLRAWRLDQLAQLEATPAGVLGRDRAGLLHSGDPRWVQPGREDLEAAKVDGLKALLQGPLSSGSIEVTIVGDVALEAAIKFTAATFGALPARPSPQPSVAAWTAGFPGATATPVERTHKGRADKAIAYVAWPTTDFFADLPRTNALRLAVDVLQNRLTDQIRVAEGATYSPDGGINMSATFPGYGYAWSMVETPPAKIASFYANVSKVTADMRINGVTGDELDRAKTPVIARLKKAELTNEYWLSCLAGSQADPRQLDMARTQIAGYEKVTVEDIGNAMAPYFTDERAWKLVVLPAAGKTAAGTAASN